jgi:beta-lactam-binding protein with PASTA domain
MIPFFRNIFKASSMVDIVKQLLIIGIIIILIILFVFYFYLPVTTHHGESITVPNIIGLVYDDLDEFLTDRNFRFEVNEDSGYNSSFPPMAVLKQYPEPGQKVKENRKIFLTLNALNPPNVRMPRLVDGSLNNAERVLESYGLIRGELIYEADPARNAVLDQLYNDETIEEGTLIPKGSSIDLVVGDGVGKVIFEMPDAQGLDLEEAKILILGSNLQVGVIKYSDAPDKVPGTVISQSPLPDVLVRIGRKVDLWVAGDDPSAEQSNEE